MAMSAVPLSPLRALPEIPELDLAVHHRVFEQASGDSYGVFALPNGSWGILIADAVGHGPAAAAVMA